MRPLGYSLGVGSAVISSAPSETFTTATLSATDSNGLEVNNTYTLTVRPSTAIAAGGSISIVGLTGSTTGDNGSLTVAGTNAAVFGSSGAWTQSSGTLVLTIAGGQSIPTGSDTVITFVIANPNSVTAGVSSVTLTSSGFSASNLTGTFLDAIALFNVTTRNTEANILASTPTNPSGEVNIAFGTDTGDFYIYTPVGSWLIYNDTPFNVYSISLDGTDDHLNIGTGIGSTFSGASSVSVSLWFNSSSLPSSPEVLIQQESSVAGDNWLFAIRLSSSSLQFGVRNSSGYPFESGGTVSANNWHHAVLTFDGSSTTMKGYLDGTLIATDSSAGSQLVTPETNSLGIIGDTARFTKSFNGLIDEVAIFSNALSASDITSIYNGGNPSDISSLNPVGWWRMGDNNSGTGTTVTDQGSGGNNGTLTNGATFSTTVPS